MTRTNRWILILLAAVLLLFAVVAVSSGFWAKGVAASAAAGRAQAMAGAKSLAALDATAAAGQFAEANRSFSSVANAVGTDSIAGAAASIPWLGRQHSAVQSLAAIGIDASSAGVELADALRSSPTATATAETTGQAGSQLSSKLANVKTALGHLSSAVDRADTLSTDGLVPPLADVVRSVQAALNEFAPPGGRGRALLELQSYLLSGNHRILVVSQDGAELRPTGGWAGSFGIVNIGSGDVQLESYQDVFVLPDPPGRVKPPPGALQTTDFNFRNANWWLDFPTSAQKMLAFWNAYGQRPVDGIVLIDTVVMQDLLAVVGPVSTPVHGETFTSENLLSRLLYLTQVERGGQWTRKNVLVELATELENRLLNASPGELAKSATVLGKAADAKHVQMYFNDQGAQDSVDQLGWSGRVAPPRGTTDVVAISNAMNKPGKVNIAMKKTIAYDVALQPDQSGETTLVLGYANTGPYLETLPGDFRDWLRVYRIPGTIFANASPKGSATTTMSEFGFPAQTRLFNVARGKRYVVTLTARVPEAMRPYASGASSGGERYQLYMVRQADLEDIPTTVTVTAPPGWQITSADAQFTASGAPVPVTVEKTRVSMGFALKGDLVLDVRLAPN